eukprot:4108460-Prymnesium_polylepis.1
MEGSDRAQLGLPGKQEALVAAVAAVAAKTIVVVVAAGPVVSPAASAADALLHASFGGQATAAALVDVLGGDVAPSGRLPFTVPASGDDVPPISSYAMAAHPGRTYRYATRPPLYPFGYGLSFASFKLSAAAVTPAVVAPWPRGRERHPQPHGGACQRGGRPALRRVARRDPAAR